MGPDGGHHVAKGFVSHRTVLKAMLGAQHGTGLDVLRVASMWITSSSIRNGLPVTGECGASVEKPKPVKEIEYRRKCLKRKKRKFSEGLSKGNLIFKISLLQILLCKVRPIPNFF